MTFHLTVDLGQVLLGVLVSIIGFLVKFQIKSFAKRLEKHEEIILTLVQDVQRLIGFAQSNGYRDSRS